MQEDTTIKSVEDEINKLFGQLGKESMEIPELLSDLELNPIRELCKKNYIVSKGDRRMKHEPIAMIRVLMFKELLGIKHYAQLVRRFHRHPEEAQRLGLVYVLTNQTISNFISERLDDDVRNLMCCAVNHIREKARETGNILDLDLTEDRNAGDGKSKRTIERHKSEHAGKVTGTLKKEIFPLLKFPLKEKARYEKQNFLDLLAYVAYENVCANQGYKLMREENGYDRKVPHSRTMLGYLKCLTSREIEEMFTQAYERVFEIAQRQGFFKNKVDLAIDFTDWLYYGNKADPMVVEGKEERGTNHRFRFVTVKIVEKNNDFVLMSLPIGNFTNHWKAVRKLIEYAKSKVKPRFFYIDRGFFSTRYMALFDVLGIKYLMPAVKNKRIQRLMEGKKSPCVMAYPIKNRFGDKASPTLVIRKARDGRDVCFATNIPILQALTYNLFDLYAKRWDIETAFRVKKHVFRPGTTSKDHKVRHYYFLFSSLMYNLWIITNSIVSIYLFNQLVDYRIITAKLFVKKFYQAYMDAIT